MPFSKKFINYGSFLLQKAFQTRYEAFLKSFKVILVEDGGRDVHYQFKFILYPGKDYEKIVYTVLGPVKLWTWPTRPFPDLPFFPFSRSCQPSFVVVPMWVVGFSQ